MKPLLLLDVDGVLNHLIYRQRVPRGFRSAHCNGYKIIYNPENTARLKRLRQHCELAWASTWEGQANEWIGPLFRLPELPVCPLDGLRDRSAHRLMAAGKTWKLPDILRYAGERPFAWVDDDIQADAVEWAAEHPNTLFIRTDPVHGLNGEVERALLSWVAKCRW